jgi:3',5'-cyclic AMP phosphodiesterase CpdA
MKKTIVHISDPHFGTENPAVLDALFTELDHKSGTRPSLVALSGDLTQRARSAQFRACRAFLDELSCSYIVVPGNHDVPLFNLAQRFLDPLGKYRALITDDLAPTYVDDTFAVAGISTAHGFTTKHGRITEDQIAVATAALAPHPDKWKVIVAHHPFVGPERAEGDLVDGANAAMTAFRKVGVHLILTGHLHVSFNDDAAMRDEAHRTISVHAGTCISTRTRGEPNNYNRLTFDGDEVRVLVRQWSGSAFVDGAHKTYRRAARGATEIRKVR